jgi:hypothetical protein
MASPEGVTAPVRNEEEKQTETETSSSNYDETQYYMSGPKLFVLIASLCLALFLLGLDTAIISTVSCPYVEFEYGKRLICTLGNPENYC